MSSGDIIDRALSEDRTIRPSPWFRSRVMRRVRATAVLPPLAFPWKRFAAGILLSLLAAVAALAGGDESATLGSHPATLVLTLVILFLVARLTARPAGAPRPGTSGRADSIAP